MEKLSRIAIAIIVMVALAISAALLTWTPSGVQADGGERSWEDESAELTRAEAYVSQSSAGGHVTFVLNDGPARAAGISDETLALLKETVAFQNALLAESRRSGVMDITLLDVDLNDYPKVKAFMDRTDAYHDSRERSRGSSAGVSGRSGDGDSSVPEGAHQCGNRDFPVPNREPDQDRRTGDGERFFANNGYHQTARYARVHYFAQPDYTKSRDLYGPYGYCAAPMFRYHGWINGPNSFTIETPEPNPEVRGYISDWPYFTWPRYVIWWHGRF